jgi:hypothetical protein
MKKLFLSACLVALHATAQAEFYTGNQLLAMMQGSTMEKMHAMGYVVGVADVWDGVKYCPGRASGGNVNAGQVNDVVQQYLILNPQIRNQTADVLTLSALSIAWPCAERGSGGRQL